METYIRYYHIKMTMASRKPLNLLIPEEKTVIIGKGTERPFSGEYDRHFDKGAYICKQCDTILYLSEHKFDSGCGWPSFDDEVHGAVERIPDADGVRTEIVCAGCGGHLGHVFTGEGITAKNERHCVNSISLKFVPEKEMETKRAVFAGGCFWGVEYYMGREPGVLRITVGYTGGQEGNPGYEAVCSGGTGHLEAVEIIFDPSKISYERLAALFFEIHDPTQVDGQGPDIGEQYLSAVFYTDEEQRRTAERLVGILENKGMKIATTVMEAGKFWKAEDYHQDYYREKGKEPYCHGYTRRFDETDLDPRIEMDK